MRAKRLPNRRKSRQQREQHIEFAWLAGDQLFRILGTWLPRRLTVTFGHQRANASCESDDQTIEQKGSIAPPIQCIRSLGRIDFTGSWSRVVRCIVGHFNGIGSFGSIWHPDKGQRSDRFVTAAFAIVCAKTDGLQWWTFGLGMELYSENWVNILRITLFHQCIKSIDLCLGHTL